MTEKYFNPFQSLEIFAPEEYRENYSKFCKSSESKTSYDESPFPRMVDMWFLSISIAVSKKLEPLSFESKKTYKIIEGSILSSDSWRVPMIMLLAISYLNDIQVLDDPKKMMNIANGLANAGFPYVVKMLEEGVAPIWSISEKLENILTDKDN